MKICTIKAGSNICEFICMKIAFFTSRWRISLLFQLEVSALFRSFSSSLIFRNCIFKKFESHFRLEELLFFSSICSQAVTNFVKYFSNLEVKIFYFNNFNRILSIKGHYLVHCLFLSPLTMTDDIAARSWTTIFFHCHEKYLFVEPVTIVETLFASLAKKYN